MYTGLYSSLMSSMGADHFTMLFSHVTKSWKSANTCNLFYRIFPDQWDHRKICDKHTRLFKEVAPQLKSREIWTCPDFAIFQIWTSWYRKSIFWAGSDFDNSWIGTGPDLAVFDIWTSPDFLIFQIWHLENDWQNGTINAIIQQYCEYYSRDKKQATFNCWLFGSWNIWLLQI